MRNSKTRQITLGALFLALGVFLPQVFHWIGAGAVFLPMHIPVLLCGYFLHPLAALATGVLTPVLSTLISGMPPVFPVLCYMLPELAAYALCVSLLTKLSWLHPLVILPIAQVIGRICSMVAVFVLTQLFSAQLASPLVFAANAFLQGWPGILVQWAVIPALLFATSRLGRKKAALL